MTGKIQMSLPRLKIGRFLFMAGFILLMIPIMPLGKHFGVAPLIIPVILTVILCGGIYAVSTKKMLFIMGTALATPMLVSIWSAFLRSDPGVPLISSVFGILFFGFTTAIILYGLFREDEVTFDIISGAITGYLIIGFMWAFIFAFLEGIERGSLLMEDRERF